MDKNCQLEGKWRPLLPHYAIAKINKIRFAAKHLRQIHTPSSITPRRMAHRLPAFSRIHKKWKLVGITKKKCYLCKTNRKQNCSTRMKWQVCI